MFESDPTQTGRPPRAAGGGHVAVAEVPLRRRHAHTVAPRSASSAISASSQWVHQDLSELRSNLAAELEAINRLESQTFTLTDDDAREEVRRIADEKKAHAGGSLLHQIERLDPKFAERARS